MSEPARPPRTEPQYKGAELDPARGPGLGCFYLQLILLAVLVVLTPVSAFAGWSPVLTIGLMVATLALLLVAGQTIIFLLRIVAAERGQRRPLASRTRTVGEIEQAGGEGAAADSGDAASRQSPDAGRAANTGDEGSGMRE